MGGVAQAESAASKVFESAIDVVVGPRGGLASVCLVEVCVREPHCRTCP
ncbi:hypothetical protein HMPREF9585_02573 [Cutibacterium acnes HL083PA1]|nr:hypothetical protein HMPREF9585_02573 [Cutibacterium acnes HL083PA1]EFS70798.1 hypothetical protein HMPREF9617_01978 [Cutibacterium acnes HL056PA1]